MNTPRRTFLKTLAGTAAAACASPLFAEPGTPKIKPPIKLGMDNFAVRALGWKAAQLLDYAAALKLDTLFISDLDSYESLDDSALREVKAKADDLKIELYAGGWSICPTSTRFKKTWGTAEEHLSTGIRVAKALGSPVFRVRPRRGGRSQDRRRDPRADGRHGEGPESVRIQGKRRGREDRDRESRRRHAFVGSSRI